MQNYFSRGTLCFSLLASIAVCQDAAVVKTNKAVSVTDNIDWVLPSDFDKALARSTAEHRLLLIKGVSFGIDVAGATCATKGKW